MKSDAVTSPANWAVASNRPTVFATVEDRRRLYALLASGCILDAVTARFLATELERAIVSPSASIPPDVVTLNSRVLFRTDAAPGTESRVLVHPEDYVPTGQHVPVTVPLGIALFGLRAGSELAFPTPGGRISRVRVERIAYQPEAAERSIGEHGSRGENMVSRSAIRASRRAESREGDHAGDQSAGRPGGGGDRVSPLREGVGHE